MFYRKIKSSLISTRQAVITFHLLGALLRLVVTAELQCFVCYQILGAIYIHADFYRYFFVCNLKQTKRVVLGVIYIGDRFKECVKNAEVRKLLRHTGFLYVQSVNLAVRSVTKN